MPSKQILIWPECNKFKIGINGERLRLTSKKGLERFEKNKEKKVEEEEKDRKVDIDLVFHMQHVRLE